MRLFYSQIIIKFTPILYLNLLKIKEKVYGSSWRTGGATANNTYGEIVTERSVKRLSKSFEFVLFSFEEVKKNGRHASACRLYEMYVKKENKLRTGFYSLF